MNNNGMLGGIFREKMLRSKKNMTAWLKLVMLFSDKLRLSWDNFFINYKI